MNKERQIKKLNEKLVGNFTVKELADEILSDKSECGHIIISSLSSENGSYAPSIWYSHGEYHKPIEYNLSENISNAVVKEVFASGGHSDMLYFFVID